jgi:hypothetical protein
MSYSRRQLYAMGEPLGDGATRRAVGGKVIYGSGGGGGNAEKQTTIVDLPEWAKPYAKESLGKAQALTSSPYQTYGGERTAQFNPLQKQAFDAAAQQDVAGQIGFGTGLAGLAGTSSFRDQGTAAGFMSPYMQQVVDQQMASAQRQADIAGTQRGAQAVRAGAFGGSRQAVENAEAARALASQKGEIQAKGLQSAYEQAQQQFNQEQATRLSAAGQLGQLGQQQFGQEMGITDLQQQLGGQQRAATQEILSTQYQDFLNQQRAPYDQLSFMSSIIRGTPMGQTTTAYQPPANPTSQLLGLATAGAGAYGAYQGARNAAGGEVKGYAAGGIASLSQPEMASAADGMSDQQLQQTQGLPSITDLARMTLAAEAQQRAQMRQAAMQQQAMMAQQPQGTVAEEQMAAIDAMDQGLGGLEVPDDLVGNEYTAAGGGIVAFQAGGAAFAPSLITGVGYEPEQESSAFGRAITGFFTRSDDLEALRKRAMVKQAQGLPLTATEVKVLQDQTSPAPATPTGGIAGDNRAALNRADAGIRSMPALTEAEKAAQAAVTTKPPAPSAAPRNTGSGAAPAGIAALMPKSIQDLQAQRRTEVEAAGKAGEKVESDLLAATKRDQDEMGPPGVEREKRQKAQEKALEGAEGKNFNMALIEAGLAIMAGNSANAFENIGKGAMVGTKAYTTGMERIQSRKEKLDESIAALDELRYSTAKVDKKELREREAAVNKAKQQTATALAAVTGEEAKVAVDMYTNQLNRQANLAAASMRASGSGAGGGNKWTDLTAAQQMDARNKATTAWGNLSGTERLKANKEVGREAWIENQAKYLATGASGAAAATGSNSDPFGIR